jgi:hypothetical protein
MIDHLANYDHSAMRPPRRWGAPTECTDESKAWTEEYKGTKPCKVPFKECTVHGRGIRPVGPGEGACACALTIVCVCGCARAAGMHACMRVVASADAPPLTRITMIGRDHNDHNDRT